jgi:hypothetical protein
MKPRSDSVLASLTDEQRVQLYDWLCFNSYSEVIKLAAKTVPDGGFDMKLHRTTLARFFEIEQEERQARELAELAAAADNATTPSAIEALEKAARDKFIRATYELAKAASHPDNYDRLERALHHMDLVKLRREEIEIQKRELAQQEERIAEQRRQWEFDAAREVMRNYVEYQKIDKRSDIDEHDKIWLARDIAFGKPPSADTGTASVPPASKPSLSSLASVQPDNVQPSTFNTPKGDLTQSDTLLHANSISTTSKSVVRESRINSEVSPRSSALNNVLNPQS